MWAHDDGMKFWKCVKTNVFQTTWNNLNIYKKIIVFCDMIVCSDYS
jgi:hypothetical protein